tara:strand:- start:645 stop:806 length:162 start_codon:yes stop_codon:yes gene_type:complete
MSKHVERPVHQIVDKISDSLERLEKQLENLGKIISGQQPPGCAQPEGNNDGDT